MKLDVSSLAHTKENNKYETVFDDQRQWRHAQY